MRKRTLCICAAVMCLLVAGCSRSQGEAEVSWRQESDLPGLTFFLPPDWQKTTSGEIALYTTPDKQVMTVNSVHSANRVGDILDPFDREDFYSRARMEALNSHFTDEDVIDVGGQNALRVTYQTLNRTELMYVVHVGVVKDDGMYLFAFLMPQSANNSATFDRVMESVRFG